MYFQGVKKGNPGQYWNKNKGYHGQFPKGIRKLIHTIFPRKHFQIMSKKDTKCLIVVFVLFTFFFGILRSYERVESTIRHSLTGGNPIE